jgi:hypothetical protein
MKAFALGILALIAWLMSFCLSACANLPQRSYSLSFTDSTGQSLSASLSLGSTKSFKK